MPDYRRPPKIEPGSEAGPSTEGGAGGADADAAAGEEDEAPPQMCESKLLALLDELHVMKEADSTAKALVFSQVGIDDCTFHVIDVALQAPFPFPCPSPPQYNTTLEWLKLRLTEEGFGYRTISGSMPLKQRTKAIEAFQKDPPTTVFLLSMRSGAGTCSLDIPGLAENIGRILGLDSFPYHTHPALASQYSTITVMLFLSGSILPIFALSWHQPNLCQPRVPDGALPQPSAGGAGHRPQLEDGAEAQRRRQALLHKGLC